MASDSVRDDVARSTALHIVELFAGLMREDEQEDAFVEVYAMVQAGLESFEIHCQAAVKSIRPSFN
jgi:hypothetical protein